MRKLTAGLLPALLILAACGTPRSNPKKTPQVGEAAPRLDLLASDGTAFSLASAVRRGPIVLIFFRGRF